MEVTAFCLFFRVSSATRYTSKYVPRASPVAFTEELKLAKKAGNFPLAANVEPLADILIGTKVRQMDKTHGHQMGQLYLYGQTHLYSHDASLSPGLMVPPEGPGD